MPIRGGLQSVRPVEVFGGIMSFSTYLFRNNHALHRVEICLSYPVFMGDRYKEEAEQSGQWMEFCFAGVSYPLLSCYQIPAAYRKAGVDQIIAPVLGPSRKHWELRRGGPQRDARVLERLDVWVNETEPLKRQPSLF